jgi:hypothetical protein
MTWKKEQRDQGIVEQLFSIITPLQKKGQSYVWQFSDEGAAVCATSMWIV